MGRINRLGANNLNVQTGLYQWIKINGSMTYANSNYRLIITDISIVASDGSTVLSTGGTPYGQSATVGSGSLGEAWDNNAGTSYYVLGAATFWTAYYLPAGMTPKYIKIKNAVSDGGSNTYVYSNASVYSSNNSTNGVDGDWDTMASGLNQTGGSSGVITTWTIA